MPSCRQSARLRESCGVPAPMRQLPCVRECTVRTTCLICPFRPRPWCSGLAGRVLPPFQACSPSHLLFPLPRNALCPRVFAPRSLTASGFLLNCRLIGGALSPKMERPMGNRTRVRPSLTPYARVISPSPTQGTSAACYPWPPVPSHVVLASACDCT